MNQQFGARVFGILLSTVCVVKLEQVAECKEGIVSARVKG